MHNDIPQQIAGSVAGPKVATVVASVTAGGGMASLLDIINSGLGLVAVIAGIILTSILIRKHSYEFKLMRRREEAERERREDNKKKS